MKKPNPLRHFDQRELIIAAFRYYLGRMTISTCFFARELAKAFVELEEGTQKIIERELEAAFKDDDEERTKKAAGEKITYLPLGWDCDRAAWEEVRNCYTARYMKAKCRWIYQNAHDEWTTDCGASFDAKDFGCDEIKICPKCGKETEV